MVYKTHFRFFFIIESSLLLKAGLFTALSLGLLLNGFCFFGEEPIVEPIVEPIIEPLEPLTKESYKNNFCLFEEFCLSKRRRQK